LAGLALTLALIAPESADAQRSGRRGASEQGAPTIRDLDTITPRLQSTSPDEIRQAIDMLTIIDHPRVIPPLADLLRAGQADQVTDRALESLRGLAHPSSLDVLTEFTQHRRVGARRRAYQAVAAIEDDRVPAILEQGLRDSDRSVRSESALALGSVGATSSLDTLFRAFERGVVEAAISIGKLGDEDSIERFSEHLGRRPLAIMLSGYQEFLGRREISNDAKAAIVGRLGEVSTPMVRRFLSDYLASFSPRDRSELKTAVEETIQRIPEA
jgi:HEAT repeat protein